MALGTLLEKLFVSVKADTSDMDGPINKSAANIRAKTRQISTDLQSIGKGMRGVGALLTVGLTAPLLLVARSAIKAASEVQEMQGKFDVVFGAAAEDARQFANTTSDAIGRSKTDVQGYLAEVQGLLVPMGLARGEAANMSQSIVKLGIDLASFNNIADEDAIKSLQQGLSGSHETLKKFGVLINETTLKQELFNTLGLEGAKNATEAQKVQARYNIILRQTADAQGDAIKTAGSAENQQKRLNAQMKEATVQLGTQLLPIYTKLVTILGDVLKAFNNLSPQMQKIIGGGIAIAAALGPVLIVLGSLVQVSGALIPVIGGLGAALGISAVAAGAFAAAFVAALAAVYAIQEGIKSLEPVVKELAQSELDSAAAKQKLLDLGNAVGASTVEEAKAHKANAEQLRAETLAQYEAARARTKALVAQVDPKKITGFRAVFDGFKNNKLAQQANRSYAGMLELDGVIKALDADIARTDATIQSFSATTVKHTGLTMDQAQALSDLNDRRAEAQAAIKLELDNLELYVAALAKSEEAGEKELIRQQLLAQGFAGSALELQNLVDKYYNAQKSVDALNDARADEQQAIKDGIRAEKEAQKERDKMTEDRFKKAAEHAQQIAEALEKQREAIKAKADQIGYDLANGIVNPLYDLVNGKSSLKDAFKGILQNINDIFMEETLWKPLEDNLRKQFSSLFEKGMSGEGGGSNFGGIGKIFGNLFGNSNAGSAGGQAGGGGFLSGIGNFFGSLFGGGKAVGGRVTPNKSYMVGENRPEMFTPDSAGRITPNPGSGGGSSGPTNYVNNFNFPNSDPEKFRASQSQVAATYQRALGRARRVS